jgi:hypothetical protein
MKKFIAIALLLLTVACNMQTTPAPTVESTPTPIPFDQTQGKPDTPTPEIVPTATIPSTPEPPPYYFTDEFDTGSPYWEILQTGGLTEPAFVYENSALRIDISSPDTWSIGIHNAHTYPSVFLRARASASPTGSVGLICLYDEEAGWYEYNVSSDGTYNALYGQWLAPGIAQYIPLVSASSVYLTAGTFNYELGLSCQENFIFLYANNVLIRRVDVANYGLTEGRIGITASSLKDAPITAIFEWVRVGVE